MGSEHSAELARLLEVGAKRLLTVQEWGKLAELMDCQRFTREIRERVEVRQTSEQLSPRIPLG
jgi:hypothetical protein